MICLVVCIKQYTLGVIAVSKKYIIEPKYRKVDVFQSTFLFYFVGLFGQPIYNDKANLHKKCST